MPEKTNTGEKLHKRLQELTAPEYKETEVQTSLIHEQWHVAIRTTAQTFC